MTKLERGYRCLVLTLCVLYAIRAGLNWRFTSGMSNSSSFDLVSAAAQWILFTAICPSCLAGLILSIKAKNSGSLWYWFTVNFVLFLLTLVY